MGLLNSRPLNSASLVVPTDGLLCSAAVLRPLASSLMPLRRAAHQSALEAVVALHGLCTNSASRREAWGSVMQ